MTAGKPAREGEVLLNTRPAGCIDASRESAADTVSLVDGRRLSYRGLVACVSELQELLCHRTDSVNAIQRNFERLSASHCKDKEAVAYLQAELQRLWQTRSQDEQQMQRYREEKESVEKELQAMQAERTSLLAEQQSLSRRCEEATRHDMQIAQAARNAQWAQCSLCCIHAWRDRVELCEAAWAQRIDTVESICYSLCESTRARAQMAVRAACAAELQRVRDCVVSCEWVPSCDSRVDDDAEGVRRCVRASGVKEVHACDTKDVHTVGKALRKDRVLALCMPSVDAPESAWMASQAHCLDETTRALWCDVQDRLQRQRCMGIAFSQAAMTGWHDEQHAALCAAERGQRATLEACACAQRAAIQEDYYQYTCSELRRRAACDRQSQQQQQQHLVQWQSRMETYMHSVQEQMEHTCQSKHDATIAQMSACQQALLTPCQTVVPDAAKLKHLASTSDAPPTSPLREAPLTNERMHARAEAAAAQAAARLQTRTLQLERTAHAKRVQHWQRWALLCTQDREVEERTHVQDMAHEQFRHLCDLAAHEQQQQQQRVMTESLLRNGSTHLTYVANAYEERWQREQHIWHTSSTQTWRACHAQRQLCCHMHAQRALCEREMWQSREELCVTVCRASESAARRRLSCKAAQCLLCWDECEARRALGEAAAHEAETVWGAACACLVREVVHGRAAAAQAGVQAHKDRIAREAAEKALAAAQESQAKWMQAAEEREEASARRAACAARQSRESAAAVSSAARALVAAEESSESLYSCPVCLQLFCRPLTSVPCGHTFCTRCFHEHPRNRAVLARKPGGVAAATSVTQMLYCPACQLYNSREQIYSVVLDRLAEKFAFRRNTLRDLLASLPSTWHANEPGE